MLDDKLSFFKKTRLNIAKSVAPVKEKSSATLTEVDLYLAPPSYRPLKDFLYSKTDISQNYCYSTSSLTISNIPILEVVISEHKLININFETVIIHDLGNIQDTLDLFPTIESFVVKFKKPFIKGKIYSKEKPEELEAKEFKERKKKPAEAAEKYELEVVAENDLPEIKQQYGDKNKFDPFDVFDLIFPALQPPLGKNFDNPIVFPRPLLAFQPEGIEFLLANPKALLGDEMGLGKTIQAIVALKVMFTTGQITSCCIVCPKALLTNWYNELCRWAPELKALRLEGGPEMRRILWHTGAHIYLCVYESLQKDLEKTIEIRSLKVDGDGHHFKCPVPECDGEIDVPFALHYSEIECPKCANKFFYPYKDDRARTHFDVLIFDEIQKTKNPKTKMTKAVRTLYANHRWALSGTPLENKLKDLVTVCETLNADLFVEMDKTNTHAVIERYRPTFIRRKKEDVLKDLEPIQTHYEWLKLSPSQQKKYDYVEANGVSDITDKGDDATVHHIFALITKLKQLCNLDPETMESSKLDYLKEKLEELTSQGDKALIFSQFPKKTIEPLLPLLDEFKPLYYHGQLNLGQRETMVRKFQDINNTENKIMFLSLKAGNAGITLTRANYVFHFDLWWNPSVSSQAAGRAHRIGQNKKVFETMLLAEDTIERRIFNILETKKQLFNVVVDDLSEEVNLTQLMSEEELFGLFGLKKRRANAATANDTIRKDFHNLDEKEFEKFVSDLFTHTGYHLNHHKRSYDGGVYMFAKKITSKGISEVIIQSMRVDNANEVVNESNLKKLLALLLSNKKITKAILVTNGSFDKAAIAFAETHKIELVDGTKLHDFIHKNYPNK